MGQSCCILYTNNEQKYTAKMNEIGRQRIQRTRTISVRINDSNDNFIKPSQNKKN
jgi:hypothetical protein